MTEYYLITGVLCRSLPKKDLRELSAGSLFLFVYADVYNCVHNVFVFVLVRLVNKVVFKRLGPDQKTQNAGVKNLLRGKYKLQHLKLYVMAISFLD